MAYTTIDDPSAYFNTLIWSGDNASPRSLTGLGFSPDWTWIKSRSDSAGHSLHDSVRGANKRLDSGGNAAEVTDHQFGRISSFDSDGFTLEEGTYTNYESGDTNMTGRTYVGWSWRASDSNAVSNTDGSITSTVSANTTAGFSVVTFTGNGSNDATIGHGLGTTPAMIITKNRDDAVLWRVFHKDLTSTNTLFLNEDFAQTAPSGHSNGYIKTVGSSTYSVYQGNSDTNGVNGSSDNMIAYCFAEKQGYSKFGSYTGNGSTDGPFVYTGFRPAWLMIKRTDSANTWYIWDNKRNTFNVCNKELRANTTDAETTTDKLDFLSNGFKIRATFSSLNASGGTYIYLTFAEHPFVSSEGVPVTAR